MEIGETLANPPTSASFIRNSSDTNRSTKLSGYAWGTIPKHVNSPS